METKKSKIQSIVNCFETGSVKGNYGDVSIFADGPGRTRQITFGKSQTTASGHLQSLLELYINKNGQYANDLKPFVGQIKSNLGLYQNKTLIETLKKSGADPIMVQCQDEFFDEKYWVPAMKWAESNGFTSNLSKLVIYDSFIHSGGILDFLRNRFPAKTPKNGGNEKDWITQYVNVRHNWLSNHSVPILRKTIYRTKDMKRAIESNDWNLDSTFIANGIKVT